MTDAGPVDRPARRTGRFHALPLVAGVLGVLVTTGLTVFVHAVVSGEERRLLTERAHEVNLVLTNTVASLSTDLSVLAGEVRLGGQAEFVPGAQAQLATAASNPRVAFALLRPSGGSYVVVAAAGHGMQRDERLPPAVAVAAEEAVADHALAATSVYHLGGARAVGFALAAPNGSVVYRQSLLGPVSAPEQAGTAPFRDVAVALYAGSLPVPGQVVVATTTRLPLPGPVRRVPLRVGVTHWTTAVAARGPLVGNVAASAPWITLGVGLVGSALVVLLLEVMASRRDVAVQAMQSEHRFAEGLQRRLLPRVPDIGGLDVASAYVPGSDLQQVGGDWFDVFPVASGTAIVIGDVMGHDVEAAAAMAQLRAAVRAYAAEGGDPASIVDRVGRLVDVFEIAAVATMICGVIEPPGPDGSRRFRWANAGHPPPLLRSPDGRTDLLAGGSSPLLGAPYTGERPVASGVLPVGSTLVLYTDGLVEVRGADVTESIGRLARVVGATPGATAAEILRAAVASRVRDQHDDVAIVVARALPGPAATHGGRAVIGADRPQPADAAT